MSLGIVEPSLRYHSDYFGMLTIFRYPEVGQTAVLMMHGLMCDMQFWIANDADLAPPFILVDEGYDVWLGNNRGNRFAQAH